MTTQKIGSGTLVLLAFASIYVAFSSVQSLGGLRGKPLLTYQFFPSQHNSRGLSRMEEYLFPYNGEEPLGNGPSTTMLLGIFSTTGDKFANRREYIRETYLAVDDDRICKLEEYKRQMQGGSVDRRCQIAYTFVVGAGGPDRPFDHHEDDTAPIALEMDDIEDADPNGDVTYLNVKENMEDGKSTTYMKFGSMMADDYGIDYIAKIDDDSVLAIQILLQFIDDDLPPTPYNRRIYGGTGWASWAHNHVYAAGQFYFMSSDLANYVSNQLTVKDKQGMMHHRHTEDADMGSFIFSHPRPIKFINLSPYKFWHHPMKTRDEFMEGWKNIVHLPMHGRLLPFFHLCPAWMSGQGV